MNIIIVKNYQELSKIAADFIIKQLSHKPTSVLGLATGSSPLGMYEALIKAYQDNRVSFSNTRVFNLDEYVGITYAHKESYHYYMYENLFNHVNIDKNRIHIPKINGTLSQSIKQFERLLALYPIDLQILGLGTNGHIGFNEPGTPFSSTTFITELNAQTRKDNARFFDSIDDVPTHAMTMGIKNIMKAKKIVLLVFGDHKKAALYNMLHNEITPKTPASILQLHSDLTIITDEAAAKYIKNEV